MDGQTIILKAFKILLLSVFLSLFFIGETWAKMPYDSLLKELSVHLQKRELYIQNKEGKIKNLKYRLHQATDGEERYKLLSDLYEQYRSYNYDSAFFYANRLIHNSYETKDTSKINDARIKLGFVLLSAGMFKETFDSLKTIHSQTLSKSSKIRYYSILARAYYDLADFNMEHYYSPYYNQLGSGYVDSIQQLTAPESYEHLYFDGLKNIKNFNSEQARKDLQKLIDDETLDNHQFAIVASTLSFIHLSSGDTATAISLLARASIRDIQSAIRETAALTNLAELLYNEGELKYAYDFIYASMEDARFYGARQRKSHIGNILPLIASSKLLNVEGQRKLLLTYAIAITILVLIVIAFVFVIRRQYKKLKKADAVIMKTNKRLSDTNYKLSEANKIKEEYIGYYFNINSEYLEKIVKFKKSIDQKLISRKYEDINFIVNSINLKQEREKLYFSFDKVFLKLFPDFVSIFNSYFKEEDQVVLENEQLLNTELRIFALIRMGITDSDKLAKILGYSVNTIYAYKNRVKSKSILPNEEFERKIMEIKAL